MMMNTEEKSNIASIDLKEWVVTYFEPIIEERFRNNEVTYLRCRYYDSSKQMSPTLKCGDNMLLQKTDEIIDWGAIHMIQTESSNIVCRPERSETPDRIILTFEDKDFGGHGQAIPVSAITDVWELVASSRIHTNTIRFKTA